MIKVEHLSVFFKKFIFILIAFGFFVNASSYAQDYIKSESTIQRNLSNIFKNYRDSVVKVTALKLADDSSEYYEAASGFFVNKDGTVITTAFVTHNSKKVWIKHNNIIYDAEIIGFDPLTGVSVIRAKSEKIPNVTSYIQMKPKCGITDISTILISISCELGFAPSPRMGILSGHDINYGSILLPTVFIRSNIPSFNGSIGGVVFDIDGNFVGMTIASLPDTHGSFVIPSNALLKIYRDILTYSKAIYAWFGINTKDAEYEGKSCVKTTMVIDGTPAYKAGLRVGDIIEKVNSININSNVHLRSITFFTPPNQTVVFEILRDKKNMKIEVLAKELSDEQMASAIKKFNDFQLNNQNLYKKSKDVVKDVEVQTIKNLKPLAN